MLKEVYSTCFLAERRSTQEERTIIQELRHEHNYQLQELLYYSFLAKSIYEYHPQNRRKRYSDLALLSLIKVVKRYALSFGYLPMTDTLKIMYCHKVNHKRIYRLKKKHNLLARKYNLRAGKYDSSKGSSGQEGQESLPPKV